MKIAIVDTYYPAFLETVKRSGDYEEVLQWTLGRCFGTFDAYSRNLKALGWEAVDIIGNHKALQSIWAESRGLADKSDQEIVLAQIAEADPDVVFMQDLSFFDAGTLRNIAKEYVLAGQCSCPMPDVKRVQEFDCLFTSFPHYVSEFNQIGVPFVQYLPLAFDIAVLERCLVSGERKLVSFVGGYGRHWQIDELFLTLAKRTPIQFWGYGFDGAPELVRKRYHGQAWGLDMYRIYMSSQIVINRHGAVAQGYANNLRMFESTGCGALLMTEYAANLTDFFSADECVAYVSADDAADQVNYYLSHPDEMKSVAVAGQQRTITEHKYSDRIGKVSSVLQECLQKKEFTC